MLVCSEINVCNKSIDNYVPSPNVTCHHVMFVIFHRYKLGKFRIPDGKYLSNKYYSKTLPHLSVMKAQKNDD